MTTAKFLNDFEGNNVFVGDDVILMTTPAEFGSCFLKRGRVISMTDKSFYVELTCGKKVSRRAHRVALSSIKPR